jgi:glycosyltransferase involved in cell wall biosynthesis
MASVLALTRYGRLGASSRVRTLAYLPHLAAAGLAVEVAPLFDDDYVARLYDGRPRSRRAVARAYLSRARRLLAARDVDVLWVEKELFPYLPAALDLLLARRAKTLVLDYDDAVFHRYDRHRSALVRGLLGRRIDRLMRAADVVVAGNPYLAERARAAGARRVEMLPTVVDLERYPAARSRTEAAARIAWIGTPRTAAYLAPLEPTFAAVARETGARFVLIGAGADALASVPGVERRAWSEATEVQDLSACDVGIMPLPDGPFERGKCAYKLVQLQALAIPVVASPVGVNATFVEHGVNGLLASDPAEWHAALTALAADPALRARLGAAGRRRVEADFALHTTAPQLVRLLQELATAPRPSARSAIVSIQGRGSD